MSRGWALGVPRLELHFPPPFSPPLLWLGQFLFLSYHSLTVTSGQPPLTPLLCTQAGSLWAPITLLVMVTLKPLIMLGSLLVHPPGLCPDRADRGHAGQTAASTPDPQVLVLESHSPLREPGFLEGMVHAKNRSGKVQDEPGCLLACALLNN